MESFWSFAQLKMRLFLFSKILITLLFQSNDNMELMSTLTSEQHVSKELAARLSQQEEELKEIREQVY